MCTLYTVYTIHTEYYNSLVYNSFIKTFTNSYLLKKLPFIKNFFSNQLLILKDASNFCEKQSNFGVLMNFKLKTEI